MRIGVDLDGVIIALTPAWLEAYNSYELEPPILPEQIVSYDFAHFVKHPKVFYSALCAGVTAKAEPEMGAISGLFQLAAAGHEVVFISYVVAQNTRGYEEKLAWLKRYGLDGFPILFAPSGQKQYVDFDILIEDYPKTIGEWLGRDPAAIANDRRAFLIDQSYNKEYNHPNCTRVTSIAEVAKILEQEALNAISK